MSTEENKALARRFADDIINRGNVDDMVDEVTPLTTSTTTLPCPRTYTVLRALKRITT